MKIIAENQTLKVIDIDRSPFNRSTFSEQALQEMAQTLKVSGQLQPIIVRPKGNKRYELVAGERRWRGCQIAGIETIRADIREMSDVEAIEFQIIENVQREDVSPLEAAEGYNRLVTQGRSVEEIAATVGKSKGHVYGLLKLVALPQEVKKLVQSGEVETQTAVLLGRIPNPDQAVKAAKQIAARQLSFRAAKDMIQADFMLQLKGAPFDLKDDTLCPKAGSCAACPKRAGNQKDLFPEFASGRGDVCTDPKCFHEKEEAAQRRRLEEFKAQGGLVLDKDEMKKAAPWGYLSDAYAELDAKCYQDPKQRTWGQLLGKEATPVMAGLVDNKVVQFVRKNDVLAVLRKKGVRFAEEAMERKEDMKREKEANQRMRLAQDLAITAIVEKASTLTDSQRWTLLLDLVLTGNYLHNDAQQRLLKRAGLIDKCVLDAGVRIGKWSKAQVAHQAVFALLLTEASLWVGSELNAPLVAAAKACKLDPNKFLKQATDQLNQLKDAKARKADGKGTKAAKKR